MFLVHAIVFVYFVYCCVFFSLLLGVLGWLRLVIVALPEPFLLTLWNVERNPLFNSLLVFSNEELHFYCF